VTSALEPHLNLNGPNKQASNNKNKSIKKSLQLLTLGSLSESGTHLHELLYFVPSFSHNEVVNECEVLSSEVKRGRRIH